MAMHTAGEGGDAAERMAAMFGPAQIDQQIRQAVQFCWMGLPQERRSVEEVERRSVGSSSEPCAISVKIDRHSAMEAKPELRYTAGHATRLPRCRSS